MTARIISSVILLLCSIALSACATHKESSAPLECHAIPNRDISLCTLSSSVENSAANDIVFYKRNSFGTLTYLEARKGDIAVTWLQGFSGGGALTVIATAEEGHPSFSIYRTDDFLNPDGRRQPVAHIGQYEIDAIHALSDSGRAIVSFYHQGRTPETCLPRDPDTLLDDSERCLIRLDLDIPEKDPNH